jgi:hypothetical protein
VLRHDFREFDAIAMQDSEVPVYRAWTRDHTIDKPVELPVLVSQVRSGRVTAESWIFADETKVWTRVSQVRS